MWKVIAIIALAFPLAFALENIRLEVRAIRQRRGKPVKPEKTDEEKFDNWYLGNEELMKNVEEKRKEKRNKREEKQEKKRQAKFEKTKNKSEEYDMKI